MKTYRISFPAQLRSMHNDLYTSQRLTFIGFILVNFYLVSDQSGRGLFGSMVCLLHGASWVRFFPPRAKEICSLNSHSLPWKVMTNQHAVSLPHHTSLLSRWEQELNSRSHTASSYNSEIVRIFSYSYKIY